MDRPSVHDPLVEDLAVVSATGSTFRDDRRVPERFMLALSVTLAAVVILAIYVLRLDQVVGEFMDDGWYAVLAKSLATGHGYNLINFPHSGHYFYPPLFPFLLSLLYRTWQDFPSNVALLKSLSIAAMLLLAVIVFRLFNRPDRLPRRLAFLLAVCTALAPTFVMMATSSLMSECVFTCLQFAALLFAERCARNQSHRARSWTPWMTAVLATAAYMTRTAGIVLLAGIGLHFLRRKMFREVGILAGTFLLFAGCWSIYSHFYTNPTQVVPGYASQFWDRRAGVRGQKVGVSDLPARIWQQSTVIVLDDVGALFAPALYRTGSESGKELDSMVELIPWLNGGNSRRVLVCTMGLTLEGQLLSLGFFIVVLVGFLASVKRDFGAMDLVFVFSLVVIVLWPWDPIRLLVPLLPIFFYYLILGIAESSRALVRPFNRLARFDALSVSRIVMLCVLGLFILDHASYLIAKQAGPGSSKYPEWLAKFNAERQAAMWIRDHTTPTEVITGDSVAALYLYSQRQTEICDFHECAKKGVRYCVRSASTQTTQGKVVFESHGVRVMDMGEPVKQAEDGSPGREPGAGLLRNTEPATRAKEY